MFSRTYPQSLTNHPEFLVTHKPPVTESFTKSYRIKTTGLVGGRCKALFWPLLGSQMVTIGMADQGAVRSFRMSIAKGTRSCSKTR